MKVKYSLDKEPRFSKLGSLALLEGNLREFSDLRNIIQGLKGILQNNQKRLQKKVSVQGSLTFFYSSKNIVTEASLGA